MLPRSRQEQIRVGDWDINIVVAGSGPPICFLHGIGLSWRWWQPALLALANEFTVGAIDLPGSGQSSPLTSAPHPSEYRTLVEQAVATLGTEPAVVVGHSLGGYVAVQSALQGARGVRGLFLVAPAGFGPIENKYFRILSVPGIGTLLSHSGRIGLPLLLQSLVYDKGPLEDMLCWADASSEARERFLFQLRLGLNGFGRTSDELIIAEAARLPMPISLIWGRHDSVFSLETAHAAARVLHTDTPLIFDHSGHFPQIEETDRFNSVLRSFVASV